MIKAGSLDLGPQPTLYLNPDLTLKLYLVDKVRILE
jgi:hypothetical protein